MSNKKSTTKKALFSSIVSLLLCFTMLIGTTFAWFTDTVTSSGNRIQAGTLQVGMEYREPGDAGWTDVEGEEVEPIFSFENIEPGYTMLRDVKISNNGSLAIQWQLNIVPQPDPEAPSTNYDLADVIDVYFAIIDEDAQKPDSFADAKTTMTYVGTLADLIADADGAAYGVLLPENGSDDFDETEAVAAGAETGSVVGRIALHMQETAGNDYQGLSIGAAFDLQLLATQFTYENDSFDNDYDANAEYPIVVNTREEAQEALDNAEDGTIIYLAEARNYGDLLIRVNEDSELVDYYYFMSNFGTNYYGKEIWQYAKRTINNLTITGVEGAVVNSLRVSDARDDSGNAKGTRNNMFEINNLTISNITTADGFFFNVSNVQVGTSATETTLVPHIKLNGLTIDSCKTTTGGVTTQAAGRKLLSISNTGSNSNAKNIVVTNCTVTDMFQGVYLVDGENVRVEGNSFSGLTHNAIHINKYCSGDIVIANNRIADVTDRPIRFYGVSSGNVVIKDNDMSNSGDGNQIFKAENMGVGVTWENNTYEGNETSLSMSGTDIIVTK